MIRLTRREEQIMQIFWKEGPMPIRRMLDYFPQPRPHFNTVSTLVRILEEKGCVGHRQEGRGYVYYPAVTSDEVGRSTVLGAITRYFNDSYLSMVSSLVKEEKVSVQELRSLLDEIEKSKGKGTEDK